MLPKDFAAGKTYPLVVTVHGGPSAACMSRWDDRSMGPLSAMGYFALCPNPRGSYGQGELFTQGNVKDFGGGDFRDIMAGEDAISKEYPIDCKRIGIRGHSYGGYMTMWAETQTHRFAAAVVGRRSFRLAELLRSQRYRRMDDSLLRGIGVRRSCGVCQE